MPKYCSVPNCRNDSGNSNGKKSFYRFPLQDPNRLQQWLRNMGCEDWVPSRHQYICHKHFADPCFKVRWGIRYLESDAVPTLFQVAEKRKAAELGVKKCKRLRGNGNVCILLPENGIQAAAGAELDGNMDMVHIYEIAVDPSQSEVSGRDGSRDSGESGAFPVAFFQTVEDLHQLGAEENAEVAAVFPAGSAQVQPVKGVRTGIPGAGPASPTAQMEEGPAFLTAENVACDPEEASDGRDGAQVIAYLEAMLGAPARAPSALFPASPSTVLSSALGSKPIASVLPIVSKHQPPSPPPGAGGAGEAGRGRGRADLDGTQQQEEHCYYKNSLSKEQLEAVVAELQKKVKVLQQRHRRHLEKLLGLESSVSRLRRSNLLHRERLQLLERALVQTGAAVSDAAGTVAILYEGDDGTFLYDP